ncbi:putative lipoprotein [Pectobacterium atrosepticum SCRI1043]|uniref:Lipoprotein n=1 Tax=Pectobacterium atrosepticum (strain SCRI 1043 / ATCC BAA-672) TaxID=218491 RepID=Q6D0Y2_PECAS|nr:hypothetical protein [Pectobacterium atrosepticum]GKV86808.1 lipoprotein [Pectobacterium carotovorum subsp. carotovorum]AIA72454.1 hypothetical protein EV46_18205 [Pectobacterium atrosepticum]AIK15436.1 putative lipoprotein [Pectobacterium atrosepticum]ATY92189.1 hypothetical protein CVS35_18480 [Pectobacterium atrosepticum]KFX14532.1 lipoprotein [Pectobacterium atrosepticum]
MKKMIVLTFGIIALAGCATKQYPQAATVTGEESGIFDCKAIKQEIAKTRSIQNEIESTGEFDGRTVLGVLGDFGIGNGMAKGEARKKAQARLTQLQALETVKCSINSNS